MLVVQPARIGRQRICPAGSTARENGASFSKDIVNLDYVDGRL
jgi:hypothetical protein